MLYLAGYMMACFVTMSGAGILLSALYRRSNLRPATGVYRQPPEIRSHALISFSIILPFAALSFLILTFAAVKIAQSQGREGHLGFVVGALSIPIVCFLSGYFYFKKVVKP